MKNLPISYKLLLAYVGPFLLAMTVVFFSVYFHTREEIEKSAAENQETIALGLKNMIETAAGAAIKNYLRATAESCLSMVATLYAMSEQGLLSESEAKSLAAAELLSQKIGATGYVYAVNGDGVLKVHPSPELIEADISRFAFIKDQTRLKNGYLEYYWKNPDEADVRPKALYMAYFPPWDWIISVSAYREEFRDLVSVSDFRDSIRASGFNKSGYSYLLNTEGYFEVHPFYEGVKKDDFTDEDRILLDRLMSLRDGFVEYEWQNPTDATPRRKVAYFKSIPEFNWIVGSSGYLDEIHETTNFIRQTYVIMFIVMAACSLAITYYVSTSFGARVRRLQKGFDLAAAGDLEVRVSVDARDEIGALSEDFNGFMRQYASNHGSLLRENAERQRAEEQLTLYRQVFENAIEGVLVTDKYGVIVKANPAFGKITGYTPEEAEGKRTSLLKSGRHGDQFYRDMWKSLMERGAWAGEIWNRRKDGAVYPEWLTISDIKDAQGRTSHFFAFFHDISEVKNKEDQVLYMAFHDALTRLPNRQAVEETLGKEIAHAARHGLKVAVFFIDLDDFKNVNDTMGHDKGDMLLQEVAERLKGAIRAEDVISRVGGDEFILVVGKLRDDNMIYSTAERVLGCFVREFEIKARDVALGASIGVAVFPDDGGDVVTLIKNADIAMYDAKAKGKNKFSLFTHQMQEAFLRRLDIESALREALKNDDLEVFHQPKYDLKTRRVTGFEALLRWRRGETRVSPGEFIPIAEESDLIKQIGLVVLEKVCRFAGRLVAGGFDLPVAINVSMRQLQDRGFPRAVLDIVEAHALPRRAIAFEVTETAVMSDSDTALAVMTELSQAGFALALDDFGTGYSSLGYVSALPLSTLKIDVSFVRRLGQGGDVFVETIVLMAKKLGLRTVAEGVETPAQLTALEAIGCDEGQGFYLGRPMPEKRAEELVFGRDEGQAA